MASLNEIANDLQAQSDLINKRGFNVNSMRGSLSRARDALRLAATDLQERDRKITELEAKCADLERAAENEALRFERYRNGDDL
ncbi:hypothetical protein [Marivita sp.]|uniref:hypothetical protein n=1 Tax=Marivita sp. TaxID=2003365 RepID=UPI003F6F5133